MQVGPSVLICLVEVGLSVWNTLDLNWSLGFEMPRLHWLFSYEMPSLSWSLCFEMPRLRWSLDFEYTRL